MKNKLKIFCKNNNASASIYSSLISLFVVAALLAVYFVGVSAVNITYEKIEPNSYDQSLKISERIISDTGSNSFFSKNWDESPETLVVLGLCASDEDSTEDTESTEDFNVQSFTGEYTVRNLPRLEKKPSGTSNWIKFKPIGPDEWIWYNPSTGEYYWGRYPPSMMAICDTDTAPSLDPLPQTTSYEFIGYTPVVNLLRDDYYNYQINNNYGLIDKSKTKTLVNEINFQKAKETLGIDQEFNMEIQYPITGEHLSYGPTLNEYSAIFSRVVSVKPELYESDLNEYAILTIRQR